MLLPRNPPDPYIPRISPSMWVAPPASDPPRLQIDACLAAAHRLRPCFGPRGLPKSLAFRFLHGLSAHPVHPTDTASVLEHMELEDPAARALASAAIAQAREVGDGAGLVLVLGACLLEQAQRLLALGLTQQEVEEGYRLACIQALELLDKGEGGLVQASLEDLREEKQVAGVLRVLLSTRVPEMADMLAEAVARCCVQSWTRDKQGILTFDPDAIRIIKTLTEGPPDSTSEELQEYPHKVSGKEKVNEKKVTAISKQQQEERDEVQKERDEVQEKRDEDSEEAKAEREGEWVVCASDEEEERPKRNQEVGGDSGGTGVQGREQQLINQILSEYICLRHMGKKPSARAHKCSEEIYQEVEADEDWEILSLALEEIRLDGEGGADGGEALGRWQNEEEEVEVEHQLLEKLQAQGDRRERSPETRAVRGTKAAAAALRGSAAAGKRLFRGLVQLGRKYLVPRGQGQGQGQARARVKGMHGVRKRGHSRKTSRPTGRVRGPRSTNGKGQHPRKNSHISRQNPQQVKSLQASLSSQEAPDQDGQRECVTITLHSPDQELLERCEAAIGACLRLYGTFQCDRRLVSGEGAMEAALSAQLCRYGLTLPGLEQMAVHGFAHALLAPVRVLGENRGTPADMAVAQVYESLRRRTSGGQGSQERLDKKEDLLESLECKRSALKKTTTAVQSVMSDLRSGSPGERKD